MAALAPAAFRRAVLAWFDRHGRHDLPWQQQRNPYRVWVSEVMLQQTQVSTVIPYFERFMQRLPDVGSLARAREDTVLHLWTGLGYYSRARNLQAAARIIQREHGGQLPQTVEALMALPGIGRSTAGAIAAQAFDRRAAILDGNARRVLARYLAIDGGPGEASTQAALWSAAERYTPARRVADYTQAVMDLGATVCTRSRPACTQCPLAASCQARAAGSPTAWPQARAKKPLPQQHWQLLLLHDAEGRVLLQKRPPAGIWGGLWCPPVSEAGDALALAGTLTGRSCLQAVRGPAIAHAFSHFRVRLEPVHVRLPATTAVAAPEGVWYNGSQRLGLPGPVKALLQTLPRS